MREDSIFLRQPEHTCIMCGWNDSRPVMSKLTGMRDEEPIVATVVLPGTRCNS